MRKVLLGVGLVLAAACATRACAAGVKWYCYHYNDGYGWVTTCLPSTEL